MGSEIDLGRWLGTNEFYTRGELTHHRHLYRLTAWFENSDVFGPPVNFEFLFSLPSSQKKEKRRQKKKIHVNLKRSQLTRRFFFSSKNVLNLNERSGECRFGWNTEIVEPRLTSRLREINERWRKRWSEHKGRKAIGKQEDYITSTIIKLIKGGSLYSLANPCLHNPCLNS